MRCVCEVPDIRNPRATFAAASIEDWKIELAGFYDCSKALLGRGTNQLRNSYASGLQ